MKPFALSVVVPNYNHGKYLPACLHSILRQTRPPDELIVVDDASTDNSVEIIEAYAKRHPQIRLHRNESNRGVLHNLNWGLDHVTGDYIYFPAADDVLQPQLFEKTMGMLEQHPQAALCCTIGDWREVATGFNWYVGVQMGDRPCYLSPRQMVLLEKKEKLHIASHTSVVRRAALLEAGGYRPELKWHCDWFGLTVAGFRHGICFVPEPLAIFNIHPQSFYKRGIRDKAAYRQVLRHMLDLLSRPEYRDAAELIRESGACYLFGKPMLKLLLTDPAYRWFITPVFLRKNLWHILRLQAKKVTPRFAAEWYFRLAGYKWEPPRSQ